MIRQKHFISIFLILFTLTAVLFNFWVISINYNSEYINNEKISDDSNFNSIFDLKNSDNGNPPLEYTAIFQNATTIYRLFESLQFDINASKFINPNYTIMQIHYSNNVVEDYDMEYVTGTNNFTYTYNPKYNAPLGFHNVSFLIYNETNVLLSSEVPITNFTITTNYLLVLNSLEYNKGETLYAELLVTDQPYDFDWNVTIVDSDNETLQNNIFDVGNNLGQFSFEIDDRFNHTNKIYYIKINMSDASNNTKAAYFPFKALNSLPEINISTIIFSPNTIKRAEDCILTLNVTDVDTYTFPENITVSMTIQLPTGELESPIEFTNNNNWTFTTTFSISINNPIGQYQIIIEAEDKYNGIDSYTASLYVENNAPEIQSYLVNGLSMNQSVSVNYGQDLIFTFDVSDVENTIAYVTVSLLDEENNWYNISRAYMSDMNILVRTEELITGVWYVYISVTDIDGATTYLNSDYGLAPQEIRIIPDLLTPVLPWIGFAFGIAIGVLAGIGLLYKTFKNKYIESKDTVPKKPTSKKISKKPKPSKKEVVKVKEEDAKVEPQETKEIRKEPQRKIKRKLK
jgi:hypothetical protein